ncbi:MAG TPA: LOG family protein, partial [Candidatus Brocadiaceae bacterium]|nr:LOG family protein [Candidatus Brocadiaceae bacterium]
FPLILVGKEYWDGLIHWIKATMLKEKTISKEDIDLMILTDDPKEVLSVINAHRDWKINMIKKSMEKKKTKGSGTKEIL